MREGQWVAADYSHTPTGSVPDVVDHGVANSSIWYAVVAALGAGVIVLAIARGAVRRR